MKPLSKLEKSEMARLGEMTPEDFSRAGVEDRHIPYVWAIATRLKEVCKSNGEQADQLERDALGKNASWGGSRRCLSDPVRYLEHNAHKAARRDGAAVRRPLRYRDTKRLIEKHL